MGVIITLNNNSEYFDVLQDIKSKIKTAQHKAVLGVNKEMIILYWNIGNVIIKNSKWGNKFIDSLAKDIKMALPNMTGYSTRNLKYMKKFTQEFPNFEFVQTVSAQLTWTHNITLLDKVKSTEQLEWYAINAVKNGWTYNVLALQISTNLYERQELVEKINNFENVLALPQSELAEQTMKDPYIFDLIEFRKDMIETEIEKELVKNITKLLLELGAGFAFVGNQYHLEVAGEDFYIDLLFYNLKLKCYFVIELKTGKFTPEIAGKMNFYLSAVDDLLCSKGDNPSIGLILCRDENKMIAEYALKDMTKPIGVSEYKFLQELPLEFQDMLPNIEDIENRIKLDIDDGIENKTF